MDSVESLLSSAKGQNKLEIGLAAKKFDNELLNQKLRAKSPALEFKMKDKTAIEFSGSQKIDIVPIINYFDSEGFFVNEAKIIKPSLEDIFVAITGIEANLMKKEKEKK